LAIQSDVQPDDPFTAPVVVTPKRSPADDVFERQGVERDQYGRPKLPDPVTGKVQSWTRVTTMAGAVEDKFHLSKWERRMVARGIALRPDLSALAASADESEPDGKGDLQRAADEAKEHAGGSSGANLGTALHSFIRRVVGGTLEVGKVPAPWRPDIEAWLAAVAAAELEPLPDTGETLIICRELGVAGSFDRLMRCKRTGKLYVTDDKSGHGELEYAQTKTSAQLAIYAHHDHWWNGSGEWQDPYPVDLATAILVHVPVGTGTCTLQSVDLAAGWRTARVAAEVYKLRKLRPVQPYKVPEAAPAQVLTPADVLALTTIEDVYAAARHLGPRWTMAHVNAAKIVRARLVAAAAGGS